MDKFYLMLIMSSLSCTAYSQERVTYGYDAAGNRVRCEIFMLAPRAKARLQSFSAEGVTYSDELDNHSVRIHQNEDEGILKVTVLGLDNSDKCSLGLYTTSGVMVAQTAIGSESVNVDISGQPAGIYMLRIALNDSSVTWKIVKK